MIDDPGIRAGWAGGEGGSGTPPHSASAGSAEDSAATPGDDRQDTAAAPGVGGQDLGATPDGPVSAEGAAPEQDDASDEAAEAAAVVDADLDELVVAQRERDEYLELAQRTRADFENFRKRATAESAAAAERGKAGLATELIGVLDNLERALEAAEIDPVAVLKGELSTDIPLAQGIAMTYRELTSSLSRAGVESYGQVGETFDPTWHEALQALPVEGAQPGSVTEVLQRGYRLGERVLRPARVTVAQ